jgi:hypothetical protein
MRHSNDVLQFDLAVPTLAVIDQPPQVVCLVSGIHALGFAKTLKIIYVAAQGGVLCVQSLLLLGISDLEEVLVVVHHNVTTGELLSGNHTPAFSTSEVNLHAFFLPVFNQLTYIFCSSDCSSTLLFLELLQTG